MPSLSDTGFSQVTCFGQEDASNHNASKGLKTSWAVGLVLFGSSWNPLYEEIWASMLEGERPHGAMWKDALPIISDIPDEAIKSPPMQADP